MVKWLCNGFLYDTTSEPHGRKCPAGSTRYCANEWRYMYRNQGGTVEYFVSHP